MHEPYQGRIHRGGTGNFPYFLVLVSGMRFILSNRKICSFCSGSNKKAASWYGGGFFIRDLTANYFFANSFRMIFSAAPALNHSICCSL